MDKMKIKNIVVNILTVSSAFLSFICVIFWYFPSLTDNSMWGAIILTLHFIIVLLMVCAGPYSKVVSNVFKSFNAVYIQFLFALIIGTIATIFSIDTVAAILPGNPYKYTNAILMGVAINYVLLFIMMGYILMLLFYVYLGYKVLTSDIKKETDQAFLYKLSLFLGLLVGLVFSYKVFIQEALNIANRYGDDLIIHAQFHKNYSCSSATRESQISYIDSTFILVFKEDEKGKDRFEKIKCNKG